ncbi:MAG TPA: NAD(P)-dependent oxidoreductase [Burkholderiaceae bacterium]|nr:NAD(P)-dependent oxidoreductase [Burkholderiaceae bacterium]
MSERVTLVTGANGFVGRGVCRALAATGTALLAADIGFDVGMPVIDGMRRVTCNVTDIDAVQRLFATNAIERVVHGGAISGPMLARDDPHKVHRVNAMGTLHLLESARVHGSRRFLLLSSIAAYGDHPTLAPVDEHAPLLATEPYGASKVAAERFALSYRESFSMEIAALRLASVYGAGRRSPCLVQSLVDATIPGAKPVPVSASPASIRQLLHVDDCVDSILCALEAPTLGQFAYNIANGVVSESDLLRHVTDAFGPPAVEIIDSPRLFDGHLGPLTTGAARRDLGFRARISVMVGVMRLDATEG